MSSENDLLSKLSEKHGVGRDAVATALAALKRGNGTMAQFSHADFGGMAQWSKGGMSMVGDMFNSGLKAKFDGVMADLAEALQSGTITNEDSEANAKSGAVDSKQRQQSSSNWWPSDLGSPSSSGSQNDMRYAFFPDAHRLVVEDGAKRTVYDTGSHMISGVSQQQSSDRTISFQSQDGVVRLGELKVVGSQ